MATEILATGKTSASTADITLDVLESANLFLKGGDPYTNEMAAVEIKDDAGGYTEIAMLESSQRGVSVVGPGIFRVTRRNGIMCGVCRG
jgi:hypothetical protein